MIELPGAKNDTQVLSFLGETAQLFFRPVDCIIPALLRPSVNHAQLPGHGYYDERPGRESEVQRKVQDHASGQHLNFEACQVRRWARRSLAAHPLERPPRVR